MRETDATLYRAKAIGDGGAVVSDARATGAADGGRLDEALERAIFEPEMERALSRTGFVRRLRSPRNGKTSALDPAIGQPTWTGTLSLGAFAEPSALDQVSQ